MNPASTHQEKKRLENPPKSIKLRIQRREKEGSTAYWETFELPYRRNLNVISALMDIRKNPVTITLVIAYRSRAGFRFRTSRIAYVSCRSRGVSDL